MTTNPELKFKYRNWRGEVSWRSVKNPRIYYGTTDWYTDPQWLVGAYDLSKDAFRTFAVANIIEFAGVPSDDKLVRRRQKG